MNFEQEESDPGLNRAAKRLAQGTTTIEYYGVTERHRNTVLRISVLAEFVSVEFIESTFCRPQLKKHISVATLYEIWVRLQHSHPMKDMQDRDEEISKDIAGSSFSSAAVPSLQSADDKDNLKMIENQNAAMKNVDEDEIEQFYKVGRPKLKSRTI